jgi:hypothetical protein
VLNNLVCKTILVRLFDHLFQSKVVEIINKAVDASMLLIKHHQLQHQSSFAINSLSFEWSIIMISITEMGSSNSEAES